MLSKKLFKKMIIVCSMIFAVVLLVYSPCLRAQTWTPLPPYNTLWPLWSPALSPADPITQVPTPIVNALSPSTVLPVQPGLTWNPYLSYPYMLYNTPEQKR